MKTISAMLLTLTLYAHGCGDDTTKPKLDGTSPVPPFDPLAELTKTLNEPGWQVVTNPLHDTILIPQSGSLTQMPEEALGTLWALRLKNPGQDSCRNAKDRPTILEEVPMGRFFNSDATKCKVKSASGKPPYTFRIDEKAAASTQVGAFVDAKIDGRRAFEVQIANPINATFEDDDACLPIEAIRRLAITASQGFCALRWAKSVQLTTLTWRSFVLVEGNISGAYVIVKVGGSLYSSTEQMSEMSILSGNYVDLVGRIKFDEATGAIDLVSGTSVPVVASLKWSDAANVRLERGALKKDDAIFKNLKTRAKEFQPFNLQP